MKNAPLQTNIYGIYINLTYSILQPVDAQESEEEAHIHNISVALLVAPL